MNPEETPKELGFRMPGEWERHSAIWLSFPHDPESFPHLEEARTSFLNFVHEISSSETVELQVLDETMQHEVAVKLAERGNSLENIQFHIREYADIWFRDYGPLFLVENDLRELAMSKWEFNAWGGKYDPLLKDNEIPYEMNEEMKLPVFKADMVLEGGSIEVNGKGTLMTTRQCLLNKNRNPKLTQTEIEGFLADYLNVRNFIWLNEGVEGDDTDGHIDDIARFVNPTTILCAREDDAGSANYKPLKENWDLLQDVKDQDGNKIKVIAIPMPGKIAAHPRPLPASYANFYIGNTKVIVPTFGTEHDKNALRIIQEVFPDRKVIGIDATYLVYGFGTFHCMSQQQPIP